jgi:excisionase family DNA binding protein
VRGLKEPLLKVRQVAARLAVSLPQAYRVIHSGEIPLVRVGERSVRVREEDVERYIREHRRKSA